MQILAGHGVELPTFTFLLIVMGSAHLALDVELPVYASLELIFLLAFCRHEVFDDALRVSCLFGLTRYCKSLNNMPI